MFQHKSVPAFIILTSLGAKSLDIENHVKVFKTALFAWPEYDKELSALSVQTTRKCVGKSPLHSNMLLIQNSFDLPDDVFEEGERKPVKMAKKKKVVQKRSASTTEVGPFYISEKK